MRVLLIHPPVNDPRSPRLALPSLAAYLRARSHSVQLLDLDVDSLLAVLRPENLDRCGQVVRARPSAPGSDRDPSSVARIIRCADTLSASIGDALAVLRSPTRFYDPTQLVTARERLFDSVDLVSLAAERPVRYDLENLRYDVQGVSPARLSDLIEVTADRRANVFADYWEGEVFPRLASQPWDLIGISIATRMQIIPGLTLARALRQRGYFVVIGGTLMPKLSAQLAHMPAFFEHFADAIVVYEGETALAALLDQLAGARDWSQVPNLLYRDHDQVRRTAAHVEDVAALPTPDFTGLPLADYLVPEPVLPVLLGKGCYWDQCKFCSSTDVNRVSPKRYRIRPPATFVDDILGLRDRFACRTFLLTDEAVPAKLLGPIADAFDARGGAHDLRLATYARLEPALSADACRDAARLGMRRFFFGLESASQQTLDHMGKGIHIADVPSILAHCNDAGVTFHAFSMVGFPQEPAEEARKTPAFFVEHAALFDHPGNSFDIHLLEIQAGTPYADEAACVGVELQRDDEDELVVSFGHRWRNVHGLSRAESTAIIGQAWDELATVYRRYHSWPSVLWPLLEEWSLLYAGRYPGEEFPFQLCFPDQDDGRCYRLRWNPSMAVERTDDTVRMVTRRGIEIDLPASLYAAFVDAPYLAGPELMSWLMRHGLAGDTPAAARDHIVQLVRDGVLQVQHDAA